MSPQALKRSIDQKIRSDSERFADSAQNEKTTDFSPKSIPRSGGRKELVLGEVTGESSTVKSSLTIFFALGLTVSLVNDFSDLALFSKMNLISQVLDIVAVFLLLFVLAFAGKKMVLAVFAILTAFVLELLLVIGVAPWWTIAVILWYIAVKKN